MHEIVPADGRSPRGDDALPPPPTAAVTDRARFSAAEIRGASCSLDKRPEGACMLSPVQSTFRESSRIVLKVLMVTGGHGGYLPSEIQGLKGWRRRWIHSATTYI